MVEFVADARAELAETVSDPSSIGGGEQLKSLLESTARPFVLANEREISVLRRGLTRAGWKREIYRQPAPKHPDLYVGAGLLAFADLALLSNIPIPERSGHYHHFFCDCGARLTIPEDLRLANDYACPSCGKTYSGDRYDGGMRYLQHRWLAAGALASALVYAIDGNKARADKAAQILLDYAQAYPGPHTGSTAGGIMYQSLCEAVWSMPLAQAYDLIHSSGSLTGEQRQTIEQKLFRPIAGGLKAMGIGGNWGSWHLSAVGVIGLAIKDEPLVRYAVDSFMSQIANQLGDDGLWPESVHTYHFYPLSAFVHLAEGCYRAGIDLYNWEARPGKSLKAMFAAPLEYAYPSFRLPAINDGWFDSFLPCDLYEIAHRRWDDPAFAHLLKKAYKCGESPINSDQREHAWAFRRNSFYALLFGRDLPGALSAPAPRSRDFPVLGICALRSSSDTMATLDYGPFLGHGHLDKMGVTLYANESLLIPDYGTPGYGSQILGWYQSTAAHNTVVVDGKSQERSKQRNLVSRYSGGLLQFAEAVADDHYPGVRQSRRVVLWGNVCVVDDALTSDSEHTYDWFMRCEGKPKVIGKPQTWDVDCSHYPLVDIRQAYRLTEPCRIDWLCEHSTMPWAIWANPKGFDVVLGECPAETGMRKVPVFICRQSGRDVRFTAVMAPTRSSEVEMSTHGSVVRVTDGGRVDHVYVRDTGLGDNGSIQTNGELAAIRTEDGAIASVALVKGTWLKWNGESILECPSQVDCVEICLSDRRPATTYSCDSSAAVKLRCGSRKLNVDGHRITVAGMSGRAMILVSSQGLATNDVDRQTS